MQTEAHYPRSWCWAFCLSCHCVIRRAEKINDFVRRDWVCVWLSCKARKRSGWGWPPVTLQQLKRFGRLNVHQADMGDQKETAYRKLFCVKVQGKEKKDKQRVLSGLLLLGTFNWGQTLTFKNTIPSWVSLASSLDHRVTSRGRCLRRHIHPRWINPSDVNTLKDRSSLKLRGVLRLKWCLAALLRIAADVLPSPGRLVI